MAWKDYLLVTEGKPLHIHCSGHLGDRTLMSWYASFTQKIVLKTSFVSSTGKDPALHFYCSVLLGDRALRQLNIFTWKKVLKKPFIIDSVECSTLHIHCLGLLGDWAHQVDTIVLLRLFVSDTRETSACLFRSARTQTSSSQYDRLAQKIVLYRALITDTGKPLYIC